MSQPTGSLRDEIPKTAALIDDLRDAFGADEINALIKAGLHGAGTFWASENGREIGSRPPPPAAGSGITADRMVIARPAPGKRP